jgi:hypothetical protein
MAEKVTGPASYFPSIEAKYGRSIDDWLDLMRATGIQSSKELVNWLKTEHDMGHGHASALAHHLLAEAKPAATKDDRVDRLFPDKKAHWRPVYDNLAEAITAAGDVKVLPKNTLVGFGTKAQFVMLQPSTPERFDVGLKLPGVEPTDRLQPAGKWNTQMTHRVSLASPDEVDVELLTWIKQAHAASL